MRDSHLFPHGQGTAADSGPATSWLGVWVWNAMGQGSDDVTPAKAPVQTSPQGRGGQESY